MEDSSMIFTLRRLSGAISEDIDERCFLRNKTCCCAVNAFLEM
jgi:hypothetical protein